MCGCIAETDGLQSRCAQPRPTGQPAVPQTPLVHHTKRMPDPPHPAQMTHSPLGHSHSRRSHESPCLTDRPILKACHDGHRRSTPALVSLLTVHFATSDKKREHPHRRGASSPPCGLAPCQRVAFLFSTFSAHSAPALAAGPPLSGELPSREYTESVYRMYCVSRPSSTSCREGWREERMEAKSFPPLRDLHL